MDLEAYQLMASHETHHWWFVGRRAVFDALLDGIALPKDARIVEAGCGTGGNLGGLQRRGRVWAFEPHPFAADTARSRHPGVILELGSLPDGLPFEGSSFDLVAALDILEHIEDDEEAIRSLVGLAKPGGYVLITVPTHPALFGSHDRRLHHMRRYSVGSLRRLCALPNVETVYSRPFNTLLAPLAVVARLAEKLPGVGVGNQERLPPAPVNRLLATIFSLEARFVRRVPMPFGLSQVVILRRTC